MKTEQIQRRNCESKISKSEMKIVGNYDWS